MKISFEKLAIELGQKVNATLAAMEGAINEHKKTHASECELRLDAALKSSHDTFEATTDLQAEWLERRLNAKLKAAVEAESKKLQLAQQSHLTKQEKHLQGQAAKLAKSHASSVEERLQQKIDSAMHAARLQTPSKLDERFGDMSSTLECDKVALKRELRDIIHSNRVKLEAKFQSQLSDFQAASSRRNSKLEHQMAQLRAAADRLNTRLSSIENQDAQENSFPYNNTDTDDLTIKVLDPKTSGLTSPATSPMVDSQVPKSASSSQDDLHSATLTLTVDNQIPTSASSLQDDLHPATSSAAVDNQVSERDSSSQDDRHLSEGRVDLLLCENSGSGDTAILTALNQINLGIEALLRKPRSPTIPSSIKHSTDDKASQIPSRTIKRRSGIPRKTPVPIQRAAGLLTTAREAATKQSKRELRNVKKNYGNANTEARKTHMTSITEYKLQTLLVLGSMGFVVSLCAV
ncbi:hypothetical protein P3T76_006630 [Phytophthora citrophthora]|uniref:Uncharacterized protein n=1 Tax=Phytophthora citrophthora TaxID=4793 RepID=A0AAD9LM98_9STRA|nr:hypothetical protein P3T76_006630 [Phytophthora citrophthora]